MMRPLLLLFVLVGLVVACKGSDPAPPAPTAEVPATTTAPAATTARPTATSTEGPRQPAWIKAASKRLVDRAQRALDQTPEPQRRQVLAALDRMATAGSDLRALANAGDIAQTSLAAVAPHGTKALYEGAMAILEGMVERLADKLKTERDAGAAVAELVGAIKTMKLPSAPPSDLERLQLTAALERVVGPVQ
jgi:hypothetical protein